MLGAIPNPKKTITIDYPLSQVKIGVERISKQAKKYEFEKSNPTFNQYTFKATETLSLGVFIDINLNSISDTKTEITIEIRRKIGSFDQAHEVQKANEHISKLLEIIANGINLNESEFEDMLNKEEIELKEKKKKKLKRRLIIWGVILLILFLLNRFNK
jgi:hypothetical protein